MGFIEIIATSVVQQMSIVFEEGGGPHTDINFGLLYHGQKKECCAFLVNNGPKEMFFKFNFHPDKSRKDFNENFSDENYACTPEEAGLEMTQRVLSTEPISGTIKAYSQIPIKFLCNTKKKKIEKGWKVTLCPEYDLINKKNKNNLRDKLSIPEHFQSLAAVKFEEVTTNKLSIIENEEDFCKPISVFMEVKAIFPDITIDKTEINFWECNVKDKKLIKLTITNKNDELPVDFCFNKIPHFTIEPSSGSIKPSLRILAMKKGADGSLSYVTDANVLTNTYTYTGFDGYYHRDKHYYRLRITRHLQELLRTGQDYGTELIIDARRSSGFHTVLNGSEADDPVRVDFVYTDMKR